ncbi:hypothetical protein INT47_008044 [Mucor saturninus]|uniref:Uncharacterized protein n=1 Tax=Mucor saturninus TaxID=64648 RepID=A0A8H7V4Z1_9FUNG|nr:hypothetical protein INT47_008044 [Mucor saturninus]
MDVKASSQVYQGETGVVTMGNWASSSTFENHCRREHLSEFDFTNTLIEDKDIEVESDEDIFMDASDSFLDSLD